MTRPTLMDESPTDRAAILSEYTLIQKENSFLDIEISISQMNAFLLAFRRDRKVLADICS